MICVRGKNVYYDDFYLSGKYFYMIYKNVVIIMWCFGFYWCKVMKEIIVLCYKYFVKKNKEKRIICYMCCNNRKMKNDWNKNWIWEDSVKWVEFYKVI